MDSIDARSEMRSDTPESDLPGPGQGTSTLSPERCASVSSAIEHHLLGKTDSSTLRKELRDVCAEARQKGMRAEQLLIAFKVISHAAISRAAPRSGKVSDTMARLVSLCIEEYYRTGPED